MKILNWLKDNLNVVSLVIGLGFIAVGDHDSGFELIKGGLT